MADGANADAAALIGDAGAEFGAFVALDSFGLNFWLSLVLVPPLLGVAGIVLERLFIRRLTPLDPLYNFLFTFGLALIW